LDTKLDSLATFDNLLRVRVKKKDLAVTLRFMRKVQGAEKMFGVQVPSDK
jgi:hypothetical protein